MCTVQQSSSKGTRVEFPNLGLARAGGWARPPRKNPKGKETDLMGKKYEVRNMNTYSLVVNFTIDS